MLDGIARRIAGRLVAGLREREQEVASLARFVDVAVPMPDPAGGPPGVLGAHLHWHWAADVVDSVLREAGSDGSIEVLIADREGRWLLKPTNEPSASLSALDAPG